MMIEETVSTFAAMPATHDTVTPIGWIACDGEHPGKNHRQHCRFGLSDTECAQGRTMILGDLKRGKPAGYDWPLWRDTAARARAAKPCPTTPIARGWITQGLTKAYRWEIACSDLRLARIAAWYADAMGAQAESAVAA